jgi:hypothetical protein
MRQPTLRGFRFRRAIASGLLLTLCWLPATPSRADTSSADVAAAQALFDQGKKAIRDGDYATACMKYEESQRLEPGSGTLFNLADCYEHLGRFATAWGLFIEVADAVQILGQVKREKTARDRARLLEPRVSHLVIHVLQKVPGLEVRRDGGIVGSVQWEAAIPIDPGQYTIRADAPGRRGWESRLTVDAAASATVRVEIPELPPAGKTTAVDPAAKSGEPAVTGSRFDPAAASPEAPSSSSSSSGSQRTLAIVAAGVGGVGLAVGSYLGLRAISLRNQGTEACPQIGCSNQDGLGLRDSAARTGNLATAAFIVAGVGLATGVVLWASAPRDEPRKAQVAVGPTGVVMSAAW